MRMPFREDEADKLNALTPPLSHVRLRRAGEGDAPDDGRRLTLARAKHGRGVLREAAHPAQREGEGQRSGGSTPLPPR
jgi:hypothetical protein